MDSLEFRIISKMTISKVRCTLRTRRCTRVSFQTRETHWRGWRWRGGERTREKTVDAYDITYTRVGCTVTKRGYRVNSTVVIFMGRFVFNVFARIYTENTCGRRSFTASTRARLDRMHVLRWSCGTETIRRGDGGGGGGVRRKSERDGLVRDAGIRDEESETP